MNKHGWESSSIIYSNQPTWLQELLHQVSSATARTNADQYERIRVLEYQLRMLVGVLVERNLITDQEVKDTLERGEILAKQSFGPPLEVSGEPMLESPDLSDLAKIVKQQLPSEPLAEMTTPVHPPAHIATVTQPTGKKSSIVKESSDFSVKER